MSEVRPWEGIINYVGWSYCFAFETFTLKHPGQRDPEKGSIGGQTPFRVNNDPEISQLDPKYDPELGQSDPIICQFDWFPGDRWPGM